MGNTINTNIQQPELWTLQLALRAKAIDYILFTDSQPDSLITGNIELDLSSGNYLKAVQNAVYDNPLLLDDYGKCRIIVESMHFVMLPGECDEWEAENVMATTFPDADADVAMCALQRCGTNLAFEITSGVLSFLQRTFNTPPIYHHLHPLCEHYKRLNEGTEISRMFLNMSPSRMDMVMYSKGLMTLANSYDYHSPEDAAYFALHAWDSMGLDRLSDEVQLTGDKAARNAIAPILRDYISFVMPAIYPAAAMRLGHDAMKAPFDLILLALCV